MAGFQRHSSRPLRYSPVAIILLVIITAVLVRSAVSVYFKAESARERSSSALYDLNQLEARKSALEGDLIRLGSEEGVDEALRAKYPVAKPGERVLVIIGEDAEVDSSTTTEKGFWGRIRRFLR